MPASHGIRTARNTGDWLEMKLVCSPSAISCFLFLVISPAAARLTAGWSRLFRQHQGVKAGVSLL